MGPSIGLTSRRCLAKPALWVSLAPVHSSSRHLPRYRRKGPGPVIPLSPSLEIPSPQRVERPDTSKGKTPWGERSPWIRWPIYVLGSFYSTLLLYWMFHRERVPITGRRQFRSPVLEFPTPYLQNDNREIVIDKDLERVLVPDDDPQVIRARLILNRILSASGLTHQKWKLIVVRAPCKSFNILQLLWIAAASTTSVDIWQSFSTHWPCRTGSWPCSVESSQPQRQMMKSPPLWATRSHMCWPDMPKPEPVGVASVGSLWHQQYHSLWPVTLSRNL